MGVVCLLRVDTTIMLTYRILSGRTSWLLKKTFCFITELRYSISGALIFKQPITSIVLGTCSCVLHLILSSTAFSFLLEIQTPRHPLEFEFELS